MSLKHISVLILLIASTFKAWVVIFAAGSLAPEDFSLLINYFNLLFISGYIFSLEQSTIINRRLNQLSFPVRKERLLSYSKDLFSVLNFIKSLFGAISLYIYFAFDSYSLLIILMLIISLQLSLVERQRFELAYGNWFIAAYLTALHITLFSAAFVVVVVCEFEILNISIVFLLTSITNHVIVDRSLLGLFIYPKFKLLRKSLKITEIALPYFTITFIGFTIPLLDKLILYKLELFDLVKDFAIVGLFAGFGSMIQQQIVNNVWQKKIIKGLEFDEIVYLTKLSLTYFFFIASGIIITVFVYLHFVEVFDYNLPHLNSLSNLGIFIVICSIAFMPVSGVVSLLLYSKGRDSKIMVYQLIEFIGRISLLLLLIYVEIEKILLLTVLLQVAIFLGKLKDATGIYRNN